MLRLFVLAVCLFTMSLIVTAQAQEVENLAINPSFEDKNDIVDDQWDPGWVTWGAENGLQSEVEFDTGDFVDGARSLKIIPVGAINWHFMVINQPIPLEKGDAHTASFWAKGKKVRPVTLKFKATDNSVDWAVTEFLLTSEWEEYHVTADAMNPLIKLEIWVSAFEVPLWLDFLNIYKGEYVEGVLPSGLTLAVQPGGKLAVKWAEIKAGR